MDCHICSKSCVSYFKTLVLKKYNVEYFKCTYCGFIQTEEPYWLNEAYRSAITDLDIGLVSRNMYYSDIIEGFFDTGLFNDKGIFLDYAGGYGLFVRIMRDKGINFYRQDVYCQNLFARHFDLDDLPDGQRFDVITAFEVFEHLVNPIEGLREMLTYTDTIVFSTELQQQANPTPDNWWYFVPETGQHISLYTHQSLQIIANNEGLNLYSNKFNLHIFSKKKLSFDPFEKLKPNYFLLISKKIINKLRPRYKKSERISLTSIDFDYIKGLM